MAASLAHLWRLAQCLFLSSHSRTPGAPPQLVSVGSNTSHKCQLVIKHFALPIASSRPHVILSGARLEPRMRGAHVG